MDLLRSLPLGLYLEQPVSWLHGLDPRVKLAWLLSLLLTPLMADPPWRLSLVALLILLTLSAAIPLRVWRQQMGWLLVLCGLAFVLTCLLDDGLSVSHQQRLPAPESALSLGETPLPQPQEYRYLLFALDLGVVNIELTRRSLELAVRVSTVIFTVLYSANLYLLTTAPEAIAAGLESLMRPLRRLNVPVTEITLTLTLSLRFIPLVLEEVQNLVRSVRTRAINWQQLGWRRSLQVWLVVVERLLKNLLLRAEQIATAMQVRGFTSPNEHRVRWHELALGRGDWLALVALVALWGGRVAWGGMA
jgi:energy-coupling factor transport system permease protein